jgi:hypothetical protein
MYQTKIIAYYLPQYHPIKENNEWWGEGFTEWTNVGKAKKYFTGHYQPKVPADLGYYDLRLPEVRQKQAELAGDAGVSAFCYWHYWFGEGRRLLEYPINEILRTGSPCFPFCFAWANHSWYKKNWNSDVSWNIGDKLIEQLYPGKEDHVRHFYSIYEALVDDRYFKIDGRPVFAVYDPLSIPCVNGFIDLWNELALKEGLKGFYFIGHTTEKDKISKIRACGFDSVNISLHHEPFARENCGINKLIRPFRILLLKKPSVVEYRKAIKYFKDPVNCEENTIPTIIPNWDHTPRSGSRGRVFNNSNPELFYDHAKDILKSVQNKKNKIAFIKSWNEWGEGNYMEPDIRYGRKYIDVLGGLVRDYGVE